MAKLERGSHAWGQRFGEIRQQLRILLQLRWELKENRAESLAQSRSNLIEIVDRVGAIPELGEMRHLLRRFQAKTKMRRGQLAPIFDRFWRRNAMKSVVDLGGAKSLGVERKHFCRG